jgi:oxalate decarboxylase
MTRQRRQADLSGPPEPIESDRGTSILGPRNLYLERENPCLLASPYTDFGLLPNMKHSFTDARNRLDTGGWAREVTVRELHWHKEAAWSFILAGRAGITAVDDQGRTFIDDVGEGDL